MIYHVCAVWSEINTLFQFVKKRLLGHRPTVYIEVAVGSGGHSGFDYVRHQQLCSTNPLLLQGKPRQQLIVTCMLYCPNNNTCKEVATVPSAKTVDFLLLHSLAIISGISTRYIPK